MDTEDSKSSCENNLEIDEYQDNDGNDEETKETVPESQENHELSEKSPEGSQTEKSEVLEEEMEGTEEAQGEKATDKKTADSDLDIGDDEPTSDPKESPEDPDTRKRPSSASSVEPVEKRLKEDFDEVGEGNKDSPIAEKSTDDNTDVPDKTESAVDPQDSTTSVPNEATSNMTKAEDLSSVNIYKTMNGHKSDDDQSTGKSEDSEKENRQLDDMPIDLTTKSSSSSMNGPDMLSEEDEDDMDEKMNNVIFCEPLQEEVVRRKKIIKRFQSELRNEEAKLVLLRKLRQSQLSHQLHEQNTVVNNNKSQSGPRQSSQPPPLIRGNQQPVQAKPAHSQPPQLIRGQVHQSRNQIQGPPPLVNMSQRMDNRQMMQMGMHGNMMAGGNSPNLMAGFRPVQNHAQPPPPPETQTPAQRQAAAKLALRKQLEKTLLQIPPPKPPPPEMNFIPGLTMPDFICLLGLEEVVNYILDADLIAKGEKSADEKMVCNPFTCCQCGSDFTPVWKREKPGSKNVVCEMCVTTNQKKALKQEHTNRLKSAFVKALQQEQEIERMQAQVTTPSTPTTTSNPPNVTTAPMNLTSTPYKPASDPLRQHQNLIHAHQASLRMGQPLGLQPFGASRGPFPYQLSFGPKHSDIQRQYLLDMIPNTRGSMPWKT